MRLSLSSSSSQICRVPRYSAHDVVSYLISNGLIFTYRAITERQQRRIFFPLIAAITTTTNRYSVGLYEEEDKGKDRATMAQATPITFVEAANVSSLQLS